MKQIIRQSIIGFYRITLKRKADRYQVYCSLMGKRQFCMYFDNMKSAKEFYNQMLDMYED